MILNVQILIANNVSHLPTFSPSLKIIEAWSPMSHARFVVTSTIDHYFQKDIGSGFGTLSANWKDQELPKKKVHKIYKAEHFIDFLYRSEEEKAQSENVASLLHMLSSSNNLISQSSFLPLENLYMLYAIRPISILRFYDAMHM